MKTRYLLDTHVLLWLYEKPDRLPKPMRKLLTRTDQTFLLCDISLLEIATGYAHGRIRLSMGLGQWLSHAVAPPRVEVMSITPAVAAEIAALGDTMHKDPADRVIVATARVLGATLITDDQQIRDAALCALF